MNLYNQTQYKRTREIFTDCTKWVCWYISTSFPNFWTQFGKIGHSVKLRYCRFSLWQNGNGDVVLNVAMSLSFPSFFLRDLMRSTLGFFCTGCPCLRPPNWWHFDAAENPAHPASSWAARLPTSWVSRPRRSDSSVGIMKMGVWQKQNVYKRVFTSSSSFLSRDRLLLGHTKVFFHFRFINYLYKIIHDICM